MNIKTNITELIGKTPIVELGRLKKEYNLKSNVFAKLESFNPAGSAKDRVALYMLNDAIKQGKINKDTVIIEPTSGNTGVGLASICAYLSYKLIITMPENMSEERINLMRAYGTTVILTDAKKGMKGAISEANHLHEEIENSFIPSQFDNPSNPLAHYETTGPEIYDDLDGNVDIFVAGIGTGGTISGVARYLKEKNPNIKVIGAEPFDSPFITKGMAGAHKLQGIGAGFIPGNLDLSLVDEVITVKTEEAYEMGNFLSKKEGILSGISSGAALFVATLIAKKESDKNIVVLLPDTGERYLSSEMYK